MDFAGAAADFLPAKKDRYSGMRSQMQFTPEEKAQQAADDRSPQNVADMDAALSHAQAKTPAQAQAYQDLHSFRASMTDGPVYQMSARDGSNPGKSYGFGDAANDFLSTQDAPKATAPIGPNTAPTDAASVMSNQTAGLGDPGMVGIGENVLHAVTSAGLMPFAGLSGLKSLITDGPEAGADAVSSMMGHAFSPRTQAGQAIQQGVGQAGARVADIASTPIRPYQAGGPLGLTAAPAAPSSIDINPVNLPGNVASAGFPGAATALRMAPDLAATLFAPEVRGIAGSAVDRAGEAFTPRPAPPRVEPSFGGSPSTPVAPPVVSASSGLAAATPEMKAAVAKAGSSMNPDVLNRHLEADTLPVPIKLTEGQATQDVNVLSKEANNRPGEVAQRYNEQNGQIIQNLDAIKQKVAPDVTAPDLSTLGQNVVDRYKAMDAKAQDVISQKYQALADANGGQLPIDGPTLVSASNAALKQAGQIRFLPNAVKEYLNDYAEGSTPMTFNDFENMRTTLAKAGRATKDGNEQAAINTVRNTIESLPMTDETAALKPLADDARRAARSRFQAIDSDPAYKAAVNDSAGVTEPSALADDFVRKYIVGGKSANVGKMISTLGDDPLAKQEIAAGLVDHLKSTSGVDLRTNAGNVSQAALNKALGTSGFGQKLDLALDPESAQQLRQLGNVARYTQAQPKGSYDNNSHTLVGAIGNKAAGVAEGMVNNAFLGAPVGTGLRSLADMGSKSRAVKRALAPGAGLTNISDIAK